MPNEIKKKKRKSNTKTTKKKVSTKNSNTRKTRVTSSNIKKTTPKKTTTKKRTINTKNNSATRNNAKKKNSTDTVLKKVSKNKTTKHNSHTIDRTSTKKRKVSNSSTKPVAKKIPNKINTKKRFDTILNTIIFWLLIIFFTSVIILCSIKIFNWYKDNLNIKNLNKDIKDDINIKKNNDDGELVEPVEDKESDYWYYVKLPFYEVDFNSLLSKNKDTVAFIHMENTNINYPVVQTNNNDYYLTHAFDKSHNDAGWVFMDYRNNINSLSDNTVIYGHGRLDKTVFGSLKDSLTKKWQANKDNYAIWLSTPKENMVFQIFSIYTIQSESYYITTDFNSASSKQKWLDTMKERNTAPIDTPVNVNNNILTLSTCQNNEGGRIVVQAKLIKKQKR